MALEDGSLGEVLAVGEFDRGWPAAAWAKLPIVKWSDLELDIIDYRVPTGPHQTRHVFI